MFFGSLNMMKKKLLICCGALAREITNIIKINKMNFVEIECLPAKLHNQPHKIATEIKKKILKAHLRGLVDQIFVAYGDCGTGGQLDKLLDTEGIERIYGNHCYEFYSGTTNFNTLVTEEIGTFFLTDYLARFFEPLIISGLGLKEKPDLRDMYFRNYKILTCLAQTKNKNLEKKARTAEKKLGLKYSYVFTGYGNLESFLHQNLGHS